MQSTPNRSQLSKFTNDLGFRSLEDRAGLPIKHLANFGPGETWSETNCTLTANTTSKVIGYQSLDMLVDAGATAETSCTLPVSAVEAMTIRGNLGLALKIDDLTKVERISIIVSEDDGTNGYWWRVYNCADSPVNFYMCKNNEWATAWMKRTSSEYTQIQAAAYGSPSDWGTTDENAEYEVLHIKIIVIAVAGQTPTVSLGAVQNQDFGKALVIFSSDDGHQSARTEMLGILNEFNFVGSASICGSGTGPLLTPLMTTAQIGVLDANKWEIVNHGWTHANGSSYGWGFTVADMIADLMRNEQYFQQNGWLRGLGIVAWPGSTAICTTGDAGTELKNIGFKMGAGKAYRLGSTPPPATGTSPWMPTDMYSIPSRNFRLTTNQAHFEAAIRDHEVIRLLTHDVQDSYVYGHTPAEIRATCNWFRGKVDEGLVVNDTLSGLYDRTWGRLYVQPVSRSILA